MESSCSHDDASRPWQSYHTVYTNAKAGMDGVDKEKVQKTVYEMSKGSKYFVNEERKEAFMRRKIDYMLAQCSRLTATDIVHFQKVASKKILQLEATRDLSQIWLHVDMDAFYAAVEMLCDPSLYGKPIAVGSMSMVATANYEARKFGVRAAMPGFIACKLCPSLILVPPNFEKYTHYSNLARKVYLRYDSHYIATSLDEAYLNITEICNARAISSGQVAEELRAGVYKETGLTCSSGVAPNRLLAKVCSDINKPNGQFILPNDRGPIMTFISSLPVRKVGGIGKVTERILLDVFGISTCEDILKNGALLCALFPCSSAEFFLSVGLGIGGTETPQVSFRKSISNERTFSSTENEVILYQKLAELAEMLSSDMHKEGLSGKTLTVKLKTASFEVRTRAITLKKYICSKDDILKYATKLLKAELPISLRLIGVRVSHFMQENQSSAPSPAQKNTLTNYLVATGEGSETDDLLEDTEGANRMIHGNQSKEIERTQLSSSHEEEGQLQLLWEDGCKCKLCGLELPPSFVVEKQEHSDFHLAMQLQQQEESPGDSFGQVPSQRPSRVGAAAAKHDRQKKQKLSSKDGPHIPIDFFFVKSSS